MNMDKIPLNEIKEEFNPATGKQVLTLFGIRITDSEFANAEKINDLIDWCRELQEKVFKLGGK